MRSRLPRAGVHTRSALALSLLTVCATTAFAEIPIPSAAPLLTPIEINISAGHQNDPHVSGDLAAYASDAEIRYFDFATSFDTAIPLGPSARDLLSDVSGTRIVFSRIVPAVKIAVIVFDTTTGSSVELSPALGTTRLGSAIGGDTVAYIDFGLQGNGELVAHDLASGVATRLTNDTNPAQSPAVSPSGAVITWEHCNVSLSNCDIRQAVRTGPGWVVSVTAATPDPEANPDTNGSTVVYDSLRAGNSDIFLKPVSGGPEVRLEMAGFQANPSIAGDLILFESRPTLLELSDLYVYDTISRRLFRLTDTPLVHEQLNDITLLPDRSLHVVWTSDEDGFDSRNVRGATFTLPSEEAVWSFGLNNSRQLGDGSPAANRAIPVRIAGLTAIALAGGREHSLALLSDGTVWAWGRNDVGQLGDGTNANRPTPVQVSGLSGVVAIAGGDDHSLALKSDGTVWAWGLNDRGQLGDTTTNDSWTPVYVYRLLHAATGIAAGAAHSLAITRRTDPACPPILLCVITEVFAWGHGRFGRLGDGTTSDSPIPVQVVGLNDVAAVAAGGAHSLALKLDGTIWSWGLNDHGQLGDGTNSNASTPVQGITYSSSAIAARGNHSLAISQTGGVGCPSFPCPPVIRVSAWGANASGQLGDGTFDDSNLPVLVTTLTNAKAISAGDDFSLATLLNGSLWTWGGNAAGQLGDGTTVVRNEPVSVVLQSVAAIGAGGSHSLASGRRAECSDGLDNDGDGKTDYASNPSLRDYGCTGLSDATETGAAACDDGTDNDGDGRLDYRIAVGVGDLGCSSHRSGFENPQCQDGIDNDLTLGIDFDGGASVNGGVPLAAADPQCTAPTTATEAIASGGCGIGPELVLLLPLLGLARANARQRPKVAGA